MYRQKDKFFSPKPIKDLIYSQFCNPTTNKAKRNFILIFAHSIVATVAK